MASAHDLRRVSSRFYTADPSQEDGRLQAHRIEFEITLRTILNYISTDKKSKVLDVGGGTGPYSFALASEGHDVTLVDLSPGLLSLAHSRIALSPSVLHSSRICESDALDLASLLPPGEAGTFDVVLLLGPLYHIMSAELREDALRQAWDMVQPGGVLFCAWVSRWAHYRDLATHEPERLAAKREFYEQHALDGNYVKLNGNGNAVHAMHHEHPANMPVVLQRITGQQTVRMVGLEGLLAGSLDKLVNDLDDDEFQAWVEKCIEVGNDEMGWMMSDHIMGVVCKPPLITVSSAN